MNFAPTVGRDTPLRGHYEVKVQKRVGQLVGITLHPSTQKRHTCGINIWLLTFVGHWNYWIDILFIWSVKMERVHTDTLYFSEALASCGPTVVTQWCGHPLTRLRLIYAFTLPCDSSWVLLKTPLQVNIWCACVDCLAVTLFLDAHMSDVWLC